MRLRKIFISLSRQETVQKLLMKEGFPRQYHSTPQGESCSCVKVHLVTTMLGCNNLYLFYIIGCNNLLYCVHSHYIRIFKTRKIIYPDKNKVKVKRFHLERKCTENIKIFLQLYMIKTDLLTCHQDLVSPYNTLIT